MAACACLGCGGGGLRLLGVLLEGLGVDLLTGGLVRRQGQHVLVLQQHHGLPVGLVGVGPVLGVGAGDHRLLGVPVGVLEHTQPEHLRQGAADGPVQHLVVQGDHIRGEAVGQGVGVIVAVGGPVIGLPAEGVVEQAGNQVHASVAYGEADPFGGVQRFHAPAHIVDDAGVGVDVALEAHLTPEDVVDGRAAPDGGQDRR